MPSDIALSALYEVDGETVCDSFNYPEQSLGYHRAVHKGPFIFTSGTAAALPNGHIEHCRDVAKQARRALETALGAVERLEGKMADVVRVKMFIAVSDFLSRRSAELSMSPSPCPSCGT